MIICGSDVILSMSIFHNILAKKKNSNHNHNTHNHIITVIPIIINILIIVITTSNNLAKVINKA